MTYDDLDDIGNGVRLGSYCYLNTYNLDRLNYSTPERIEVAEHEMGHAIGLDHNTYNDESVMTRAPRYPYGIQLCDEAGVIGLYNEGANDLHKRIMWDGALNSSVKGLLNVDYVNDYSGNKGLGLLKAQAPIIVEGTVTSSQYHNDVKNDDYHTDQTLTVDRTLKGHIDGKVTFEQSGTNKVAVNNSILLNKGQKVIVMLNKDSKGHYYVINNGQGIFTRNHLVGAVDGNNSKDNNLFFTRASDNSNYSLKDL